MAIPINLKCYCNVIKGYVVMYLYLRHLLDNESITTIKCSKQSNVPCLCGAYLLQERNEHYTLK